MTAMLPDATDSLVTSSEKLTTISYSSGWLADAGATVRGCRDDGCGHACQISKRRAESFRMTEFWMFAQLRGLLNSQKTLFHGRRFRLIYTYSNYAEIHQ